MKDRYVRQMMLGIFMHCILHVVYHYDILTHMNLRFIGIRSEEEDRPVLELV